MPQIDIDGAASRISADNIRGQSGSTITIVSGHSLSGSGSGLTALPAANLTGTLPAISGANLTNLNGSNIASGTVAAARLPALGKVLQVVQTHDTTPRSQSVSATTVTNVSGLSATITPSATSSKVFIQVRWNGESSNTGDFWDILFGIKRGSTEVGSSPSTGDNRRAGLSVISGGGYHLLNTTSTPEMCNYEYLDSPSTTSATTYYATILPNGACTFVTNRVGTDNNNSYVERMTSTITLWEIGA